MVRQGKVCLNMIVRNEAHVITETLDSVSRLIDYWVIVDTGSQDGTQQIIESYFQEKGIEGELHSREWRNFGLNRTEALKLCRGKGEYAWVVDADDLLQGSLDFSQLELDSYSLKFGLDFTYWRKQLFRTSMDWKYIGVVHEYPDCDQPASHGRIEGEYHMVSRRLGARNLDPRKYQRDIQLLTEALDTNPNCTRSAFYLAQSHYDNGDHDQALHWYRKRVILGGWWEEIFYSKLRIGQCLESLGKGFGEVSAAYLDCFEYRPQRAEPLFELARMCREHKRHQAGYLYARAGVDIPFPENDLLFVNAAVYRWRLQDELAIHAYYTDRFAESASLLKDLLASGEAPPEHGSRLRENLRFATQKLSHAP